MIIDTPGFGDTRGHAQDLIISKKIKELFTADRRGNYHLSELHAVCFVGHSGNERITPTQEYILASITEMFGCDVASHFVIMATFCDGGEVLLKNALNASKSF